MSNDPASPIQVEFTPEFHRSLRQLAKKYRHIKSDLDPIIEDLRKGNKPGDQVPHVGYEVFKVRAKNSDARKGKSGGYRLIYYVKSESHRVLVTVYSKSEQADIATEDIRQIILDLDSGPAPDTDKQQGSAAAEAAWELRRADGATAVDGRARDLPAAGERCRDGHVAEPVVPGGEEAPGSILAAGGEHRTGDVDGVPQRSHRQALALQTSERVTDT
jgi:mRNA-degrading endonuclease RelE of RelBE toxin-antitoxin system